MGGLKRNPWLFGLGVLLAILMMSRGYVRADVTTDQAGSIIIFPKVVADGTRDTLISIVNVKNMPTLAHCIYNEEPFGFCSLTRTQLCRFNEDCPTTETCQISVPPFAGRCSVTSTTGCQVDSQCPGFETCVFQCLEHNFDIALTGQQPTFWLVGLGREIIGDFPGLSPGRVPFQENFIGELKCYVTDPNGNPFPQNSLAGTAIIAGSSATDVSEYNAITVQANNAASGDLNLNSPPQTGGTIPGEYNSCPASLIVNHWADGSIDSFSRQVNGVDGEAHIFTELTLVPCTEDFENQIPAPARALVDIWNEFEQRISRPIDVGCYLNRELSEIDPVFTRASITTDFAKTRITSPGGNVCYTGNARGQACSSNADCPGFLTTANGTVLGCLPRPGLLAVTEEFWQTPSPETPTSGPITSTTSSGTAAANSHVEGNRSGVCGANGTPPTCGDIIVLPLPGSP